MDEFDQAPVYKIVPLAFPNSSGNLIDVEKIKKLSSKGLSECPPEDRFVAWMIMLGVYPRVSTDWLKVRRETRSAYIDFMNLFGVQEWHTYDIPDFMLKDQYVLEDRKLMSVIHGDIVRTTRHICFLPVKETPEGSDESPFREHMRRLERILYIFGRCNPGAYYLQGYNELVVPLYFVVVSAASFLNDDMLEVEAITLNAFQRLLTSTDLHLLYTTQDQSSIIMHRLGDFDIVLREQAPDISAIMENLGIHPLDYCYRWFNLLFAQEHQLPPLLLLWDGIFAHIDKLVEFLFYVGVAHLKNIVHRLNPCDFPETITALQDLRISNVFPLLRDADNMWQNKAKKPKSSVFNWKWPVKQM